MTSFLAEQLHCLGQRVRAEPDKADRDEWASRAEETAEMMAFAVHLLQRIEAAASRKQPADGAWDEAAAREFIPVYREWFEYATVVRDLRHACKAHGHPVAGAEEFLHGYNRAKMMARDFDSLVAAARAIDEGKRRGRPLSEVADELRGRDRARGG